jgi:ABC-type multidrug transport system fused ATPase/permease subunit
MRMSAYYTTRQAICKIGQKCHHYGAMVSRIQKITSMGRLIRRAFHSYTRTFFLLVSMGFLGGLFDGIGIASVIPLFYVMTGQAVQGADAVTRIILWFFGLIRLPPTPPLLLGFIVILFILKGFIQFAVRYANARIVSRFEESTRRTLLSRVFHADWSYLARQKMGMLESVLLYDTERSAGILNTLSNTILLCTTFAAYIVVALTISAPITLTTLAVGVVIFGALKPVFYRIRKLQAAAADAQKSMSHLVAEHMGMIKSIKAMALESPVLVRAFAMFARLRRAKTDTALYRQSSLAFIDPIGLIVIAILFLLNWRRPGFSIVSFAVTMYLVQKMFAYVNSISGQLQTISEAFPYMQAVLDWRRRAIRHAEPDIGAKPFTLHTGLTFESVTFSYPGSAPVLNGFSLQIPKGHLVGLVGASGVGKTTVADLVLRLLVPQGGIILADGTDIRDIRLHEWRRHSAYVPQDGMLINASVRENIRFYSDATDAQIESAARQANIHETIMGLADGYDAPVGERGVKLSGGQRQRMILARALARQPDILILDEATSAIDHESETLIRTSISGLRGKVTVIMIAHRLSSIMEADSVVILENGTVREQGNPRELARQEDSQLAKLLAASHIES